MESQFESSDNRSKELSSKEMMVGVLVRKKELQESVQIMGCACQPNVVDFFTNSTDDYARSKRKLSYQYYK